MQPPADDMKARWWAWHKENPKVWALFERFALEALDKGMTRLSGWLIVNRIRWEVAMTKGEEFKVRNEFIALYVRLFQKRHPQQAKMFTTKPQAAARRDAKNGAARVTMHPCAALPEGAIKTFDLIASGHQPAAPCPWIALLIRRALIQEGPDYEIGRSAASGDPIMAPCYHPSPGAMKRWRAYQRASGRFRD